MRGEPPHLASGLAARERARRYRLAARLGALLGFGVAPVLVHHSIMPSSARLLAGIEHLGTLCLTAVHLLLVPVHRSFYAVLAAGVAYALWDRLRAWQAHRRALAALEVRQPDPDDPFARAATLTGVSPERLRIVAGLPNPAFTSGLLSPSVYLAEQLAERLTERELAAVIAHEGAHVARRDPLRFFLLRLLACTLFWIPALRRLVEDVRDEAEVLADDRAARDNPLVLASAILSLANWDAPCARDAAVSVGFRRDALLDRRIRRLAGEDVGLQSHATRRSSLAAALVLAVMWSCAFVMAHPLPTAEHAHTRVSHHCEHLRESALGHLFCLGAPWLGGASAECPHGNHEA